MRVQEAVREPYFAIMATFDGTGAIKIVANSNGKTLALSMQPAIAAPVRCRAYPPRLSLRTERLRSVEATGATWWTEYPEAALAPQRAGDASPGY